MTPSQLQAEARQANIDSLAGQLYDRYRLCSMCFGLVTLAEQLQGRCPRCHSLLLAGPITLDRAREILSTLKRRRVELGLNSETNRG